MKKIIFFLIAVSSFLGAFAQNNTTDNQDEPKVTYKPDVIIIPFETRMYFSDLDKDLSQKTELNFHQIKAKFRAALDQNIYIALKEYYNPFSFYTIEQNEAMKELSYIYNSIGYKYEVVPEVEVVEKESKGKKLLSKFKKSSKNEDEYTEASIQDGQIVSQVDNREKYMKTKIINDKLLPHLNKQYNTSYYLFINQLDIKRSADMRYVATEEAYKREIKVHYTIIDFKGKVVSSGAIKTRFASTQNDIDKIIKKQFPLIAQRIVSKLGEQNQTNVK